MTKPQRCWHVFTEHVGFARVAYHMTWKTLELVCFVQSIAGSTECRYLIFLDES